MNSITDEVLKNIFILLPPPVQAACRCVCSKWRKIVDSLSNIDKFWRERCKNDYGNICESVYNKTKPKLTWYYIYRSLSLWPKLDRIPNITYDAVHVDDILDCQVLSEGCIGVHTKEAILYFDVNTLQQLQREKINGNYRKYRENQYFIALLDYEQQLTILSKLVRHFRNEMNSYRLLNVKTFLIIEDVIYYVTNNENIFSFELVDGWFSYSQIRNVKDGVLALGSHNGNLCVLTYSLNICELYGDVLISQKSIEKRNYLLELRKYNFLEQLDWKTCYHWMTFHTKCEDVLSLSEILTIRSYGPIILAGYHWGILRIFYSPLTDDLDDFMMSEPIKMIQLSDNHPGDLMCPILQIDVIESKNCHKVLVVIPEKIFVVNFKHSSK